MQQECPSCIGDIPGTLHVCALCTMLALLNASLYVSLCRFVCQEHLQAMPGDDVHSSLQGSILLDDDRLLHMLHATMRPQFVRLRAQAMPAAIGLLMPAAVLLASVFLGDDRLLLATCAAPYLLTLLSQIWMEGHFVKQGACQLPLAVPLTRQSWRPP